MCPRCQSADVSRSHSHKLRDLFMALFRMRPFRCRQCQTRFYLPAARASQVERERAWMREAERHRDRRS